ncbi:hypothetical protein [Microbacterium sp. USHLN186]|uniref:hypothetical protein n=1 Tax=Microbacterium sp. USHLN186 TaxID=3081286 RepID=UPI00301A8267
MKTGFKALGAILLAGALMSGASAASAAPPRAQVYTCTGGSVPSGTYSQLIIAGACDVGAGAEITVTGNLVVQQGAVFDAQSAPSTLVVRQNVTSRAGSMLGLGCQPGQPGNSGHPCMLDETGRSDITVHGNINADRAVGLFLNGVTVGRNVSVTGGGSDIPWSIKNNMIAGNLTVRGITEEWIGVMWNRIAGNVVLTDITMTGLDDQAGTGLNDVFVVRNEIGRNLVCNGLVPGAFGYGNSIAGHATGQCAALAG